MIAIRALAASLVDAILRRIASTKRDMYQGGRPNAVMRLVNRFDAMMYGTWLSPRQTAVLNVMGRRSGKIVSVPVAVVDCDGAEFLVSMLGPDANWVRNIRAAAGEATIFRHGREIPVRLVEEPAECRAEILKRYLSVAPGARPHLGLGPSAPLSEFQRIAARYPVFRILFREGK
ncbi:MAG TPA: nitroreductase/quinone reductase family protein [Thermomicrobiales bacterium]|nr:nitroreductase/quinone reductase family protein [Thermomicrobiales bacterium]